MLANYHTHTVRCHHAVGTEREYIEAAIRAGFKTLGFSDHVPQPYPERFDSGIRMDMEELPDYTGTLTALKEEYRDRIEILIGYEVEYTHKYFRPLLKELCKFPIDYMILGQHYVPDEVEGHYTGAPTDSEERLKAYADLVIEGMETGLFAYLAHPDLINFIGDDRVYRHHMMRVIEAATELGIPLEVNLYGFIDRRQYPSERFFRMASEAGAEFIIGCDAHMPDMLVTPEGIPPLKRFLKNCGITVGDNVLDLSGDF
ncbi:MAG: histidinol-phosphatase, partial [Ruminococcus sp.]|nr:histidinol-phosphatase [Ruminococcus sp.]